VYDLVDRYLAPGQGWKGVIRGPGKFLTRELSGLVPSYRRAIREMCRRADAVVCTTEEQAEDIRPYCSEVHVIQDIQDELVTSRKTEYERVGPLNLVWHGVPENVAAFDQLAYGLTTLSSRIGITLRLITRAEYYRLGERFLRRETAAALRHLPVELHVHEWDAATVAPLATACDLAVLPLDLGNPLLAGKPETKLLFFWTLGLPVLASASRAHVEAFSEAGVDGICRLPEDWATKLDHFANEKNARAAQAHAGRDYALPRVSADALLALWDEVVALAMD